jgi:hypothetical protein
VTYMCRRPQGDGYSFIFLPAGPVEDWGAAVPEAAPVLAAAAAMADLVVLVSSRTPVLPLDNRFYCSGLP